MKVTTWMIAIGLTMMTAAHVTAQPVPAPAAATPIARLSVGQDATRATEQTRDAIKLALAAAKHAIADASAATVKAAHALTWKADVAATTAQQKIIAANKTMTHAISAAMTKAEAAATHAMEATKLAVEKANATSVLAVQSNMAATKKAAVDARDALTKALKAATGSVRAAREAAQKSWKKDMSDAAPTPPLGPPKR